MSHRIHLLILAAVAVLLAVGLGAFVHAQDNTPPPQSVTIAGTIQSVLGCDGDWQPECDKTFLTYNAANDLWMATWDLPAGSYEYKAALNAGWDENYGKGAAAGGDNIPLELTEDTSVTFWYDHKTHWVSDNVNSILANVPGSYQAAIGCPGDWAPDCLRTLLEDPDGDGVYTYSTFLIPPGDYEAKVAYNQSWDLNYGLDGAQNGPNIPFSVPAVGHDVTFSYNTADHIMTIAVSEEPVATAEQIAAAMAGAQVGDLSTAKAQWVAADTIAWKVPAEVAIYKLYYSPDAALKIEDGKVVGGESLSLRVDKAGLNEDILAKFPQLAGYTAFKIKEEDLSKVPDILKGQFAVSVSGTGGKIKDATGLQIPGVLDDLYTYDGPLGVIYDGDTPTLKVWAPTAQNVRLHLFDNPRPDTEATVLDMELDPATGVWSIAGQPGWTYMFYLYEVTVFAPTTGKIEANLVTDPYSFSLSTNSLRSQIVDLYNDASLMPPGWSEMEKPALAAPEDIVIYELHVRDFSAHDESVPANFRGTFMAFTVPDSNGMQHLKALADAGLTHVHLLPMFDIATINEDKSTWQSPDWATLAGFPPDSEEQQALIDPIRDEDGFNWGYDPYHYTTPEGSYSTNPNGTTRILQFRRMVEGLDGIGLRVVMDVVYNHTNASGQADKSVLDKIVPGYYHRLNGVGAVETSTCCQNTATEHNMMRKLMVDSVVTWAKAYKVDGFRFDLMGHHMKADMLAVRSALDALTLEKDGVDGKSIYVYGEGWNFGEVANDARGVNATQLNMAGTGIGTFNDRVRDSARGGSPFGGQQEQGFINGLYTDPNGITPGTPDEQKARLFLFEDRIRVGLAGNLADFSFVGASGETITGADVDYNGSPTGYTQDPQEDINYVSAHDNETLFDKIQYAAPADATVMDRVRMQNMGISIVALSQGVPFYHAGIDMLRSKSMDRNSYNSGDWFNVLDFTYQTDGWGHGLPLAGDNGSMWDVMRPLLGNPDIMPDQDAIAATNAHMREMLEIRKSSPLFRLQTGQDVMDRLHFYNTGPDQVPGLIVMSISDMGTLEDLDPNYERVVVLFNASNEKISYTVDELARLGLVLHPVQAESADAIVQTSSFEPLTGTFTVPAMTTAVFVLPECCQQ
jgi:pullulanase